MTASAVWSSSFGARSETYWHPSGSTPPGSPIAEVNVLRLVADGAYTSEIARELSCSESTVKQVLQTLTTRLNLRNRSHAMAFALRSVGGHEYFPHTDEHRFALGGVAPQHP